jgi:hypothetical protein
MRGEPAAVLRSVGNLRWVEIGVKVEAEFLVDRRVMVPATEYFVIDKSGIAETLKLAVQGIDQHFDMIDAGPAEQTKRLSAQRSLDNPQLAIVAKTFEVGDQIP